jgi:hypothetical protein
VAAVEPPHGAPSNMQFCGSPGVRPSAVTPRNPMPIISPAVRLLLNWFGVNVKCWPETAWLAR